MMNSGIYMWTSPSGKSYIGQTIDLHRRKNEFLRFTSKYGRGSKINYARKKYCKESDWVYKVLEYCNIDMLDKREKHYIALYNTINNGYNSEGGGNAKKFISDETRKRMSNRKKGEKHPLYGKHRSDITKNKISVSKLGHIVSDDTRHKMSLSNKRRRKVIQYTKDYSFVNEYITIKDATIMTNIKTSHISECCQGKRKTAGGFIWEYKKEDD